MNNLETGNKFLKKSVHFNIFSTAPKICGPFLKIVLARIFGATEFGIFASTEALLSWASVLMTFVCMGAIFISSSTAPFIFAELLVLVALEIQWPREKRRLA